MVLIPVVNLNVSAGGPIIRHSTFDDPNPEVLGSCALVEEVMIGEDTVIRFAGCAKNEACTVILRGSGSHILETSIFLRKHSFRIDMILYLE